MNIDQHYWILDGHTPVPCPSLLEWGRWFETAHRHVALDKIGNKRISTVFLGLNHYHCFGKGEPVLFETMVFDDKDRLMDEYCRRYSTWEEAESGHYAVVAIIRAVG